MEQSVAQMCREWAQGLIVDLIPQPDVPTRTKLLEKASRYLLSRGELSASAIPPHPKGACFHRRLSSTC